jgi:hypothetical protein
MEPERSRENSERRGVGEETMASRIDAGDASGRRRELRWVVDMSGEY